MKFKYIFMFSLFMASINNIIFSVADLANNVRTREETDRTMKTVGLVVLGVGVVAAVVVAGPAIASSSVVAAGTAKVSAFAAAATTKAGVAIGSMKAWMFGKAATSSAVAGRSLLLSSRLAGASLVGAPVEAQAGATVGAGFISLSWGKVSSLLESTKKSIDDFPENHPDMKAAGVFVGDLAVSTAANTYFSKGLSHVNGDAKKQEDKDKELALLSKRVGELNDRLKKQEG